MPEPAALEHAQGEARVDEPLHRPWVGLVCALGVLAMLVVGFLALPREASPLPEIARYAMEIALPQWKIPVPVNEIVYGTRGFDTFGETFLLLAAVVSVSTLARHRERRTEFVGEEAAGGEEQQESDPDRSGSSGRASGGGQHSGGKGRAKSGGGDRGERGGGGEPRDGDEDGEENGGDDANRGGAGGDEGGEDRDSGSDDGGVAESTGERDARRAEAEEAGEDTLEQEGRRGRRGGRPRIPGSIRERFGADRNLVGSGAPERSEAMTVVVRVAARTGAVILGVASVYLFARGFTPGGGFPAGAAISGVALLLYAALGYRSVSTAVRPAVLEPIEMAGALIVIGLAVTGFFTHGAVMANWLPLAPLQTIASGGLLQAFSSTEFLEVATGLMVAIFGLLAMKHDWTPDKPEEEEDTGDGDSGDEQSGDDDSGGGDTGDEQSGGDGAGGRESGDKRSRRGGSREGHAS